MSIKLRTRTYQDNDPSQTTTFLFIQSHASMFNRRRYNRKSGKRKAFRPRVRKKGVILKPPERNQYIPPKPDFDASGIAPYMWQYCPQSEPIKVKHRLDTIPSLKNICALVLAENADALEPSYLSTCSWTCWRPVWEVICQWNLDSPYIFKMFAKQFGSMPGFKCHYMRLTDIGPRSSALASAVIPVRSHRIDNVFANISHRDFVAFLAGFDAHVILDCSSLKDLDKSQALNFCNTPNLAGLDLSHNDWVDDQFLYTLGRAISFKDLPKLGLLRLVNCPNVSDRGFLEFLRQLLAQLTFISTDIRALTKSTFQARLEEKPELPVPDSNWDLLLAHSAHYSMLLKYNLTMSAHYLLRNTDKLHIPTNSPIWDIKMYKECVDFRDFKTFYCKLEDTWRSREKSSMLRPVSNLFVYIRREGVSSPPNLSVRDVKSLANVHKSTVIDSAITKRVPKRKPKYKLKDTNAFFGV